MVGTSLSHYTIVAELGRGGMGVVYKAEDTKLKRTVALKLLPPSTLGGAEERARFFREAQAAAQLHHANIATVFAIEETEPDDRGQKQSFIAMEYIEGETLTEHIAERPMKLREVVDVSTQVALALEAAHEKNIVHRDVKSGNVMLTAKGVVKVLDFGLAKTSQSTKLTQLGSTLGTIAYMSPEQARGDEVDRRSDLWSLGVLMYEMIAARLPFASEYQQAAVYSILNEEPEPLTSIRTGVPMGLEWIVLKLLSKDAKDRYQNVSDLLVDLRNVNLQSSGASRITKPTTMVSAAPPPTRIRPERSRATMLKYGIGAALGAGLMLLAWILVSGTDTASAARPTLRLTHNLPTRSAPHVIDLSDDGTRLAFADGEGVHVLDLTTGVTSTVAGTENTVFLELSPDGQWLLLTKTSSIERIPIAGGPAVTVIRTTEGGPRASWGPDGWIVLEENANVYRYLESRDELIPVSRVDSTAGEEDVDWPSVLPGGRIVMGTLERGTAAPPQVRFWDFETGDVLKTVNFPGYRVQYLRTGHLVGYVANEGLVVVPFDLKNLEIIGPRIPVVADVSAAQFSVSQTGTLIYVNPDTDTQNLVRSIPAILTFPQLMQRLPLEPGYYSNLELSPDESKVAYVKWGGAYGLVGNVVWILDLEGGQPAAITGPDIGGVSDLQWMPDGDSIAYVRANVQGGPQAIYVRAVDGSGAERLLKPATSRIGDFDISPDGATIVYVFRTGIGTALLQTYDIATGGRATIDGDDVPSDFAHVEIFPDGIHVIYRKNDAVYIGRLDGASIPYNLTRGFSRYPRWTSDGKHLFVVSIGGSVQIGARTPGPTLDFVSDFSEEAVLGDVVPYFDVFRDGERAIVADILNDPAESDSLASVANPIHVVINWFEELAQ